ncbi:uncharacterized protein LOC110265137 [Arachis ipaensis]|uniref:uncharacterized protein LOC110265137 n=1 Tax=Arachis ipaensis TaxID=130454 RepID=UPI000A2AF60E|nr:uncharacterized protein LOC110265137 [Arachis ipaensis]
MTNKLAFEALDRTFRDLMSSNVASARDIPFGGKVIVLGGDFRQVLPVIPKGTRAEIVMASINSSILWKHCKVMWLTKNFRLGKNSVLSNLDEIKEFSDWILKIGEGSCGNQKEDEIIVDIPSDLLIPPTDNPIQDIVSAIYSNIHDNYGNVSYFQECAILAPTVDILQQINDFVVDSFPGPEKVYLSSDSICCSHFQDGIDTDWLTTEFLNQITCFGIPKHALKLKKGVPIILLRNIDQANGLCNGTRLIVQDLGENIIGAEIVSGSNIGDNFYSSDEFNTQ